MSRESFVTVVTNCADPAPNYKHGNRMLSATAGTSAPRRKIEILMSFKTKRSVWHGAPKRRPVSVCDQISISQVVCEYFPRGSIWDAKLQELTHDLIRKRWSCVRHACLTFEDWG